MGQQRIYSFGHVLSTQASSYPSTANWLENGWLKDSCIVQVFFFTLNILQAFELPLPFHRGQGLPVGILLMFSAGEKLVDEENHWWVKMLARQPSTHGQFPWCQALYEMPMPETTTVLPICWQEFKGLSQLWDRAYLDSSFLSLWKEFTPTWNQTTSTISLQSSQCFA